MGNCTEEANNSCSRLVPTIVEDHTDVASGDHAVCKHGIEKDPSVLTIVHVDG
jgi:hypothetical protein